MSPIALFKAAHTLTSTKSHSRHIQLPLHSTPIKSNFRHIELPSNADRIHLPLHSTSATSIFRYIQLPPHPTPTTFNFRHIQLPLHSTSATSNFHFRRFGLQALRIRILRLCLHLIVVLVILPYSSWNQTVARKDPPATKVTWPAVLVHATRIVRNLSGSSAARQELRAEEFLVDCLVWIIRVGVRTGDFNNKVSASLILE